MKPVSILMVDVADLKDAYVLDDHGSPIGRALTVLAGVEGGDRVLAKLASGDCLELPLASLAIDGLGRLWLTKPWQNVASSSSAETRFAGAKRQLVSIAKRY